MRQGAALAIGKCTVSRCSTLMHGNFYRDILDLEGAEEGREGPRRTEKEERQSASEEE